MSDPRIVRATIGPFPRPLPAGLCDPMPTVTATFDDGSTTELFSFYPDEISFTETEFIGLTEAEASRLRHRKDVANLQAE